MLDPVEIDPGHIRLFSVMRHFRNAEASLVPQIAPYYEAFAQSRRWPRYDQSVLWLTKEKSFYWAIINDCLLTLKKKVIMGNPVLYLILPPMSRTGDTKAERDLIERFAELGIATRTSEEDVELLGLSENVAPRKKLEEFIYRSSDILHLDGKDMAHFRQARNRLERYRNDGRVRIHIYQGNLQKEELSDLNRYVTFVAKRWAAHKKSEAGSMGAGKHLMSSLASLLPHAPWPLFTLVLHDTDAFPTAKAFCVGEGVAPDKGIIALRLQTYDSKLFDFARALHFIECDYWNHFVGVDAILNMGLARYISDGLAESKLILRPIKVLPILEYQARRKIGMDEFRTILPGGVSVWDDHPSSPRHS